MTRLANFISDFDEIVNKSQHAIVAGHVAPDGDAVGSCFAMAHFLANRGLEVEIYLEPYSDKFSFLSGGEWLVPLVPEREKTPQVINARPPTEGSFDATTDNKKPVADLFIALDCGDKKRLPPAAIQAFNQATITVNIDHHISNDSFADFNLVEISSSTSELLYKIYAPLGDITFSMGEALYLGILTDTGGFRFDSATKDTFQIIGNLVDCGVDFSSIYNEIFQMKTIKQVDIFKVVLSRYTIDSGICYSYTTRKDMRRHGAIYSDLDGVINYLLDIEGVHTAILFSERNKSVAKASFRSNELDVCDIASSLGGGGHKKAAATTIDMPIEKAISLVLERTKEFLKEKEE